MKAGEIVTGVVTNKTTFGCFVDIGVGQDGLIHISKMRNEAPKIGDRVDAYVLNVDETKKRIQLGLEKII